MHAGLIHGIVSLKNGNPTKILEKRSEYSNNRLNGIILRQESIEILKRHAVYERLINNSSVFHEAMFVTIENLENALKIIISELTGEQIILYDSSVSQIISYPGKKADLVISHSDGSSSKLSSIDAIINAEGCHSNTNKILKNFRTELVQPIPIVGAILKKTKASSRMGSIFLEPMKNAAIVCYYYARLFSSHLLFSKRKIAAFCNFNLSGECYIGSYPSYKESEKLRKLTQAINERKTALEEDAQSDINSLQESLKRAENKKETYLKHWIYLTLCYANMPRLLRILFDLRKSNMPISLNPIEQKSSLRLENNRSAYSYLHIEKMSVFEVGSDRAENCCYKLGNSLVFIVGDALVTSDLSTALGCHTAILSSEFFQKILLQLESSFPIEETEKILSRIKCTYEQYCDSLIQKSYYYSFVSRKRYRPETV